MKTHFKNETVQVTFIAAFLCLLKSKGNIVFLMQLFSVELLHFIFQDNVSFLCFLFIPGGI